MAEFDTVSVDQLDTITLALEQYLSVANVNGKLFKSKIGDLAIFITPFISAIGASGLVFPDGSNVLPNPTATVKGSIVGAGTFTWTGGTLTTTGLLNIIATNSAGNAYYLVKSITTGDVISRSEFNALGISTDSTGNLNVVDNNGNISFKITKSGSIGFVSLTQPTAERLKIQLGIGVTTKKVYGKKVSLLADSIGSSNGSSFIAETDTFLGLLRDKQNCTVFRNSVPGSAIMTGGEAPIDFTDDARWQSLNSTFTPDIILIEGGINDFLQDLPLGVIADTSKTVSFYGALNYLYKSIMARNPNTRVFHMTPLHTIYAQGGGFIPEYNGQNFLTDYVDAIKKVAARYGVGIIDTNQKSGITCYNIASLSSDNIHIKEVGHMMVYNTIVNELETYL